MRKDDKQLKLKIPEELHRFIKLSAAANRRSMNSEVVVRLEGSRRQEDAGKLKEAA